VFKPFCTALEGRKIEPSILLEPDAPRAAVADVRTILQEALTQTAVRTTAYYTIPDLAIFAASGTDILAALLSSLADQLGFPFTKAYAGRVGNFEIFEMHDWLDGHQPVVIEGLPREGTELEGPLSLEISRTLEFARNSHRAHVVGRANDDVVFDQLVSLPAGAPRVPVSFPERVEQIEFRVFNESGEALLHSERSNFITRVGLVTSMIGKQITIEDSLARGASQAGLSASGVVAQSSTRTMVGAPKNRSARWFAEEMEGVVAAHFPAPSEDRWFPKGIEGEVGAITHLNHLLHGGAIRSAVLVDPWFGAHALQRFALRLSSQDVRLTIVTSWVSRNPDTGEPFGPQRDPVTELRAALERIAPFLNPRLTIVNLADGTGQAFHDRYLLLYAHEGPPKVFLLSNSLNAAAGDWPFVISRLAPDVAREVQRYIEGLCGGYDTARNKALTITYQWPGDV
jgi:hypothetical protein